jgi:hypothetical protein
VALQRERHRTHLPNSDKPPPPPPPLLPPPPPQGLMLDPALGWSAEMARVI